MCTNFSPELLGGGWVGGGEGVGGWGREEAKALQVKTRGPELPTDGPDPYNQAEGTSFRSRGRIPGR